MSPRFAVPILLVLSAAIYVGTAGSPGLVDESDCAHAVAAREMHETRDWAVLRIDGIRYLEKAPLHYWLVAATYSLLGENDFATRLPAALATVGLVLMAYVFGRRFFGERAGFYAGLVLCSSIGVLVFTRTMIPEVIYALEFAGVFYLFLLTWQRSIASRAGYWGAAALAALATLTRGLIGLVFPLAILALFLILSGGWRRWRELPAVSSLLVFLAIALPWHLVAARRAPGFLSFYIFNEHILRAIGARYPQDSATVPLLVWWAAHLGWFFPWSFFLPQALRQFPAPRAWSIGSGPAARSPEAQGVEARLLLFIWAGFILLFFSFTRRLEYYSFGAWPAVAILLGQGLARAEEHKDRWLPRIQTALALVGLASAVVLGGLVWLSRNVSRQGTASLFQTKPPEFYKVAMANFFDLTPPAFALLRLPALLAAFSLFLGLAVAWWLRRRGSALAATLAMALSATGLLFAASDAYRAFEPHLSSRVLAAEIARYLRPEDQLLLYGDFYKSCTVSFYTHRKAWIWNGRYNALEFGSYYPDAPKIFLTDQGFPAFWRGPYRVFLAVPGLYRREALLRLPADSTYLLASQGGKAVFVNQRVTPGQPTLAQLRSNSGSVRGLD